MHIVTGSPTTFGYLRRADLDHGTCGDVWEAPDGMLHVFERGRVAMLARLPLPPSVKIS